MTLPLFLLDPGRASAARVGGPVVLDGAEGRHAVTVRRIGVGERVLLTDGRGRVLEVEVTGTEPTVLTSRVLAARSEPEPRPRFVLVQALAKGGRDEDAIEASTELGVDEVVPWQAARSIVRWRGELVDAEAVGVDGRVGDGVGDDGDEFVEELRPTARFVAGLAPVVRRDEQVVACSRQRDVEESTILFQPALVDRLLV